jgi:SET domain-containing protein
VNVFDLEIRDTPHKGRGLFTLKSIARGEKVLTLEGIVLKTADLTDNYLALQIDHDLWLCSEGDALDDCINHSCEPNTGFTSGEPVLFALRDIEAGEELSWDYSTSLSEAGWSLDCRCGSSTCRGVIRPWGELAPAERDRLRDIALRYLRDS